MVCRRDSGDSDSARSFCPSRVRLVGLLANLGSFVGALNDQLEATPAESRLHGQGSTRARGSMHAKAIEAAIGIGDGVKRTQAGDVLFRDAKDDPRFCKIEPGVASFALTRLPRRSGPGSFQWRRRRSWMSVPRGLLARSKTSSWWMPGPPATFATSRARIWKETRAAA